MSFDMTVFRGWQLMGYEYLVFSWYELPCGAVVASYDVMHQCSCCDSCLLVNERLVLLDEQLFNGLDDTHDVVTILSIHILCIVN